MFNFFFLQGFPVLIFFKIVILIFDVFLTVFVLIVLRQIISMNSLVSEVHDALILKTLAIVNVIIAISLFLTVLVIL